MSLRLCHTCKHASSIPPELEQQLADILRSYPYKYYCIKLQVVKVYSPERPTQVFECEFFEPKE